eukprot:PhF_6_TR26291/c0_g1_i2/m.37683
MFFPHGKNCGHILGTLERIIQKTLFMDSATVEGWIRLLCERLLNLSPDVILANRSISDEIDPVVISFTYDVFDELAQHECVQNNEELQNHIESVIVPNMLQIANLSTNTFVV